MKATYRALCEKFEFKVKGMLKAYSRFEYLSSAIANAYSNIIDPHNENDIELQKSEIQRVIKILKDYPEPQRIMMEQIGIVSNFFDQYYLQRRIWAKFLLGMKINDLSYL